MASRFIVDSSPPNSPAPATPAKFGRGTDFSFLPDHPSTTPGGPPPPSSVASTTPAGAPSVSYMGSSLLHGMSDTKPLNFGLSNNTGSGRNLFGRNSATGNQLGRSIRGRQPSGLSRQFSATEEEDEDQGQDVEEEMELPPHRGSLFRMSAAPEERPREVDAEIERYIDQDIDGDDGEDAEYEDEERVFDRQSSEEADMFLNMRHDDRAYGQPMIGDESDLMLLNTPAATSRVRREAESIFRQTSTHLGMSGRPEGFQFASIAKNLYNQYEPAQIVEPADMILDTEELVCRLYEEGVGTEEDPEKMDNSLSNITFRLTELWNKCVDGLPQPEGEDFASVGPGLNTEPFEKAAYIAQLILRMHHTRFDNDTDEEKTPPLPEIMFDWMQKSHNLYPDQVRDISRHSPSPACHSLFWQTVRCSLLRGDVRSASYLLREAGWEHVRRGPRGDYAYIGKSLENVRRFAAATADVLDQCPAARSEWDIWNSNWTLFRIQARGSLNRMTLFAEGKEQDVQDLMDDPQPQSLSTMARKASSQIPWDIYENLQTVYGIILGNHEDIMEVAQDWCEATIGLFGWWDDGNQRHKALRFSQSQLRASSRFAGSEDYFDRLATAFHMVTASDLNPNVMNPVEVAVASAFEGNVNAVLGFLRIWSLPLACTVAEVASLGEWLPAPDVPSLFPTDSLDMDDLALLGVTQPGPDELEGIKDTTLVLYARELAGIEELSPERDGWEMAIQVLGRMDSPEKSEETVGELLRDLLDTLTENSGPTVDKIWAILNDLGMINYAEETAETFAEILSKESHRYGEALWYYALSHRSDKVREVLNLLMSYSLVQSTVYPSEKDLDQELKDLLRKRTETLEKRAKQDLEAAQLLGRMLSGYATLRKFYELRDAEDFDDISPTKALRLKKQAASALVAVISSSDDNIRGGLYDDTRDSVVSEDFLLALLGEATVFISQSPAVITLSQIDILLKAIEDIQTVGDRVYSACDDFFNLVLASAQGLKGSTPQDLMAKSTAGLGGSFMMTGSSVLVNHLHKSISAGAKVNRGWDWRKGWLATSKGEDVLRKLRLGLAKDLAALWLEDADGVVSY
ncbi:nuclear pore complex subunit nup85 [Fusarium sporotrichioides]|uniref:Nuclear pore complex protein Nup85 n=1 Tax=Fusarium sporotrichioides TaxID=5514 RepID=A0A395S0P2_FUSSP|nr:nuclear pore complex subunit nup85 [Fusarium sporotrichioides]